MISSSSGLINLKPEDGVRGASSTDDGSGRVGGGGGDSSEAPVVKDQFLLYRELKIVNKKERGCTAKERISKMPPCAAGKRSSIYRGVTRHRWTGRYEAHLWDKTTWNQNQNKKGKQVYLGAYDEEEAAARAYDLAALKYWGRGTLINFPATDYARDLDEMQNLSREEYLASLRRKSSGFSRGISKYRRLSSQWESSFGRMAGTEYFNVHYAGDDTVTEGKYIGGFCIKRKIDLTSYIKWWGADKSHQAEPVTKSSEEAKHCCSEDIGSELKSLECAVQPIQPYQMPQLSTSHEGKRIKCSKMSVLSILSKSAAYKSLQEKASKKLETDADNNENENKNNTSRMDCGKAIEKSANCNGESEGIGVASGMTGGDLPLQQNVFPLASFLSEPLLNNYSTIEPLVDPIPWSSLVPVLSTGLPCPAEVTKSEPSSTCTFFRQEE